MPAPLAEAEPIRRPGPPGPGTEVPWALPGDWPTGPARDLGGAAWAHEAGPFEVHGFTFTIRTTDRSLGEHLDDLLTHLSTGRRAEHRYSVVGDPSTGALTVHLDDRELKRAPHLAAAYRFVLWHLNRMVVYAAADKLVFHAAAATWGDGALLLPAPMEAGKTTLVAGLVERGMGYLTDEAAAVGLTDGIVHPYAKALSVDPGSWRVLPHLHPRVPPELRRLALRQWQVPPTAIRPGCLAGPTPARWIVFPRYRPEGRTELGPVGPSDAVARLAASSFNLSWHRRAGFGAIVELVRTCACFELTVAELAEACELVLEVTRG